MIHRLTLLAAFLLAPLPVPAEALCARDALERDVCLPEPATRIVSLSPGATELLFSAGAGDRVVGAGAWSDYPPEAEQLPRIGDSNRLDLEAILALQPDLVVAWVDGNSRQQVKRLEQLGMTAFWLSPREFEDIPRALEHLSVLAGTSEVAELAAESFRAGIRELQDRYQNAEPIRVFYQIWDQPLMTINREELIGKAIELCGGVNVFGHLPRLVPRISTEAVLEAAPQVIVTSGREQNDRAWLADWQTYPSLPAVAAGNLFLEPPDLLARPTMRMLEGVSHLCQTLETARGRL
ncbi:MAG: cobalamin-binding protein [Marinobacter sp.]|uniref:cobalamin-binding protein n=1 Tax=Marinobacter sp. TaxID=50741 RepID=UPI0029C16005|nr:cobalamin-binding protein [Marinobacter sp.]MDX5334862.1 cobalamin-binding protein [Marinobacter sp.]MDX5385524.1 cobalamin-binding protein [Marinobacter sp.]MDX5440449.1 cobalamin-binding protein [Alteromonadaceae bacterium]MDX5471151.1 cobalamin-binding protein [Marinobacter sp.]